MTRGAYQKFKETLLFVYENTHSDFYRVKYERAGFNPRTDFNSMEDIGRIPLLTKRELTEAGNDKILFVPEEEVRSIASSSGTTGKPLVVRFSASQPTTDPLDYRTPGAVLLLNSPFMAGRMLARYLQIHRGPTILGDTRNLPASCEIASKTGTTLITTTPSLAILLKKYIVQYPELVQSFKYLRLGSELLTSAKKKVLQ